MPQWTCLFTPFLHKPSETSSHPSDVSGTSSVSSPCWSIAYLKTGIANKHGAALGVGLGGPGSATSWLGEHWGNDPAGFRIHGWEPIPRVGLELWRPCSLPRAPPACSAVVITPIPSYPVRGRLEARNLSMPLKQRTVIAGFHSSLMILSLATHP